MRITHLGLAVVTEENKMGKAELANEVATLEKEFLKIVEDSKEITESEESEQTSGETTPTEEISEQEGEVEQAGEIEGKEGEEEGGEIEEKPGKKPSEYYQHKYDVLRGKYEAEIPRFQEQTKEQQSQINNLKSEIESLKTQLSEREEKRVTEENDLMSKDLEQDLGHEAAQKISKFIKREIAAGINKQEKEIESKFKKAEATQAEKDYQSYIKEVDRQVKDRIGIFKNQHFLDWLKVQDPFSGVTRGELLNQAHNKLDSERVITIFNEYNSNGKKPVPKEKKIPEISPGKSKPSKASELSDSGKKIYTQKEIDFVLSPEGKKKYGDKWESISRDIELAAVEGRIP